MPKAPGYTTTEPRHFYHRGYIIRKVQGGTLSAAYAYINCNWHLPKFFRWKDKNAAELKKYINCLTEAREKDAAWYVEHGFVHSISYQDPPPKTEKIVQLSPTRLLAVLRGEDPLWVTSDTLIRFASIGSTKASYMPVSVQAAIVSTETEELYINELNKRVQQGLPIVYCHSRRIPQMADRALVEAGAHHTGVNLDMLDRQEPEPAEEPAPPPAEESTIHTNEFDGYTERVSMMAQAGQKPYFIRRLFAAGRLLWGGTAYRVNGPWKQFHCDPGALSALGISP